MRSGSRKNLPLRAFTLLLLLGAVAFAAGCSTAQSPNGSGTNVNHVLPSGSSVAGWLVVPSGGSHASTATVDSIAGGGSSSCTQCHGSDLSGGISGVSCFGNPAGCHHVPVAGWVAEPPAAQNHGVSAKRAPGSSGFAACQICHGKDFSGGGALTPCFPCHGVSAPHPSRPWRGPTYTHVDTNNSNAPVCAPCHFAGSPINPPNHPAAPAPAGTAPGCFNSTLCHGAAVGHPAGWVAVPPAPQPHGIDAKAANGYPGCQTCHGADFAGTAASGNVSCFNNALCHGATATWPHAPAPWRASAGSTYTHTTTVETGNAAVCAVCHFPGSPNNPPNHPLTPAPAGTPPGCFNSTLCHNGGSGAPHSVPFNDSSHFSETAATFPANCSACHDVSAPTVKSGPACQTCHVAASPLASLNCTSCHAGPPSGGAPAGAAYPNVPGAHATHIALSGAGTPISCDTCHNGLGSGTLNHYSRAKSRVPPGDVALLATYNAKTVPFSFDNIALVCSNVSCHGGQATPDWQSGALVVDDQCTNCHVSGTTQFNSFASGEHTFHVNLFGATTIACKLCHNTTALAVDHFTTLADNTISPAVAAATVGGTGTAVTTYTAGSCTPQAGIGCHGTRDWQ